jgi:hypothetical protein
MKYLAVILALIIGTPSIANAGELDGKALICKEDGEKDKYRYSVYAFRDGKVKTFSAPKKKDWRKRGFVMRRVTPSYRVEPFEITWAETTYKDNKAYYTVNRRTLQLSYKNYYFKREFTSACKVSSHKDVPAFFDKNIRNMESEMKKNKL